jgi:hypothetical protein
MNALSTIFTLLRSDQCSLLEQALAFVEEVATIRQNMKIPGQFEFIIAASSGELNVRFHTIREGENWLGDDIEAYEEAVATLTVPARSTASGDPGQSPP